MTRMIDDIINSGVSLVPWGGLPANDVAIYNLATFWEDRGDEAESVVADNVAEWVCGNHPELFTRHIAYEPVKDFPAVLPPFNLMWLERRVPKTHIEGVKEHGRSTFGKDASVPSTMGAIVFCNRRFEWEAALAGLIADGHKPSSVPTVRNAVRLCRDYPKSDYVMMWMPVLEFAKFPGRHLRLPLCGVPITAAGDLMASAKSFIEYDEGVTDGKSLEDVVPVLSDHSFLLYSVLSFLNCKNVSASAVVPDAPLQRRRRERGQFPLVSYKVLKVGPVGETLKREGRVGEVGMSKALHICRGHFKTYSADKPLLGRTSGRFWWPSHARGDDKLGTVVKDYVLTDAQRHSMQAEVCDSIGKSIDVGRRAKLLSRLKGEQDEKRKGRKR